MQVNLLSEGSRYVNMLQGGKATDIMGDAAFTNVMQSYDMRKQGIVTSICPWPWSPLQDATGGIEREDYIIIYGRPKSMKTWVMCYLIAWCWMQGKKPLIYTKEMTAENIFQRIFTILAGVSYARFRKGKLERDEEERLMYVKAQIEMHRYERPLVCLSGKDTGEGGDTVPWLRSKIEEHEPHIAFVDGLYLMSDPKGGPNQKDNFRVQNISRGLRQTVLDTNVPIIGTLQANRDAAKNKDANLDEIAFSDAIGQDATLAMRVINEKNEDTLALMIGGSREFSFPAFASLASPPPTSTTLVKSLRRKSLAPSAKIPIQGFPRKACSPKGKGEGQGGSAYVHRG